MNRLLILLLLLVSTAAGARMYQWQDPTSKSMQFSGVPPAWYRSPEAGQLPRVRVFEGGTLVDDTQIRLSAEDDKSMRELAFRALQEEQEMESIKRLERTARREENRRLQAQRDAARAETKTAEVSDTTEAPPEVLPEELGPEMVERLKSIISNYDRGNDPAAGEFAPRSTFEAPKAGSATP